MEYRVLGPLEVTDGDRSVPLGGRRQRLVLAVLLCHPNQVLDTDWLVDAVWGDHPPRTARKTLQAYVTRLRHALGEDAIQSAANGYAFRARGDEVDACRFERWLSAGAALLDEKPSAARSQLGQALALWRGRPYGDLAGETALLAEVTRLLELRLEAVEHRIDADLALGGDAGLLPELECLVAEHPHRERLRGQLMLALYRAGRQADAVGLFEQTRRALADELGIDPGPDLAHLHERILRHDPELVAAQAAPPEVTPATDLPNPYKGLRTFTEDDRDDFFGRTDLIDDLIDAVRTRPLVTVVGASGSGKSSVVRAGLLPRLRTDRPPWRVVTIVPGRHPFEALRAATSDGPASEWRGDDLDVLRAVQAQIPDDDARALLVVDQVEELLTHSDDASTRDRFLANLAEVVEDPESRTTVLLTLRADFVDQMLTAPRLGPHVVDSLVGVPPLTPVEIEQAAAGPAGRLGVCLEPELLAELVGDMTAQPGALPLFEYALTETFEHRDGTDLTRAGYRSLGGLRGALARRAEMTYEALGAEQRAAARQVFVRLVTIGSGGEDIRRTVLRDELESIGTEDETRAALDAFDRARLLTFDRDPATGTATVEIAHEALMCAWPRLAGWLSHARDDLRLQQVLATEVSEWEAAGQSPDYLLAGSRLATYDNWPGPGTLEATKAESLFLSRSRDSEGERQEKRRRGLRRLRALLVAVTVVALVAAGLAVLAVDRGAKAEAAAEAAHARDLARASLDALVSDADLSLLLALEAVRVGTADGSRAPEAVAALQTAVSEHRLVSRFDDADDLAFLSDGSLLVAGGTTRQVDPANGSDLRTLDVTYRTYWAATSTDGEIAATASFGEVHVWDDESLASLQTLALDPQAVDGPFGCDPTSPIALALSDDHSLLVTMSDTGKGGVQVRSTTTWDPVASRAVAGVRGFTLWTSDRPRLTPAFLGSSSVLVPVNDEVRLLEVDTNGWRLFSDTGGSGVTGVAGTVDSTVVATDEDGVMRLWSASGDLLDSVQVSDVAVTSVAAFPGAARVVTGDAQGRVGTWSVQSGAITAVESFKGADDTLLNLSVDGDGALIAGTDARGRGYVWHASSTALRDPAEGPGGGPVAFSPTGDRLAVADPAAPAVHVRDLETGESVQRLTFPDVEWRIEIDDVAFCPDDDCIVCAHVWPDAAWANPNLYSTLRLDLGSGATAPAWVSTRPVTGVAFSREPALMAVSTCHGGAAFYVLDPDRSTSLRTGGMVMSEDVVAEDSVECGRAVDITPDGSRVAVLASGADRPSVRVHSVAEGTVLASADHDPGTAGSVRFSPDGTLLLTAGQDGNARIWDATTGQQTLVIPGGGGPMASALWGPDGDTVMTSSGDGIARTWDAATGEQIGAVPAHGTAPFLAVSPDGTRLATSADGVVRLWPLDVEELVAIAESRVTRGLTQAECDRYDVDPCRLDPR